MIASIVATLLTVQAATAERLGGWGDETMEMIRRDFYLPDKMLYAEDFTPGTPSRQPAFNWGVGVMLSALNAAARYDDKYKPSLDEFATASHIYWNETGPVPGYDVLPSPKPVDRYYDDNAWMVMQLIETYDLLKKEKYLAWAKETLKFVLSGEDTKIGGGIYWKETDKGGKATCSSGPAAAACLAVYRHTKDSRYLVDAIRIYEWTKQKLQDPDDFLFWDAISLEGRVDTSKWSYNTALMIRAAADLHAYTKNGSYVRDLVRMQSSSAKRWLGESLKDEGRFAHLLMDAWLYQRYRLPVKNPKQAESDQAAFTGPLTWLHENGRSEDGYYGKRFDAPPKPDQKKFALLDQASAARAYFSAANYFRKKDQ
ncbi:MAG: glycoside hydrolase family 76 protein [Fimbriimonas sp.]